MKRGLLVISLVVAGAFLASQTAFAYKYEKPNAKSAAAKAEKKAEAAKPAKAPKVKKTTMTKKPPKTESKETVEEAPATPRPTYEADVRWEYKAERMKPPKNEKWMSRWNGLGEEGWELVEEIEGVYIFKRGTGKSRHAWMQ